MYLTRTYPLGSLMDNNTEIINANLGGLRRYIDEAKHWLEYDECNNYWNFYYAIEHATNYADSLTKLIPEYVLLRNATKGEN